MPTNLLVPTYVQMLRALSAWLAKARDRDPAGADALMAARLAPDMYPLATQVRFACVQAHEAVARLEGPEFPPIVEELRLEGVSANDDPGTMDAAQGRISQTIAMLEGLAPDALDADPRSPMAHGLANGMVFDLTALGYARDWTLPQFYFHVMIAYAILRAKGVDLGKADYAAHMFAFLRPGTIPSG